MSDLENKRHSLAHLLAKAVFKIDPQAKLGIGPTIENGFYYDILFSKKIDEGILPELENLMKEDIKANLKFQGKKVDFKTAQKLFQNQPFKLKLLNDLRKYGTTDYHEIQLIKNKKKKSKKLNFITLYYTGDFVDLCKGGHVKETSEINPNSLKLIKIAGAYWRGEEKNPMLTRIYGVYFDTEKELKEHLESLEVQEKYNHRVLGEKLKIFMICEEVGKGLPLFLPRGEKIIYLLKDYMRQKEEKNGYLYVSTPVLASPKLYEISGHLKYYSQNMYKVLSPENEDFFLKPMNCPHHHMIYREMVKSYRDLPLRFAEAGFVHRYEKSGEVYGLMRVRGFTQNDAHIYVAPEQLKEEFVKVIKLFQEVYNDLKISGYWYRLSLPDFRGKNKNKFGGDLKLWQWANKLISSICREEKIDYVEGIGEAAFYGPKLDVQIKNIYGKEETIATVQVDILQAKRFSLSYVDNKNKNQLPIIIHRAIIGSYERFLGFLLEYFRGDLPLWLSPVQVVILPIKEENENYAFKLLDLFEKENIRTEVWKAEETLSKRILVAETEKIPIILAVGDKETKKKTVSLRVRKRGDLGEKKIEEVIRFLNEEIRKFN